MAFFPLSILALAAGIYLLIKVKREYLGGIFEILSWLVIAASIVAIGFGGVRAFHHGGKGNCHGGKCVQKEVRIEKRCDGHIAGKCQTQGCHIQGDSVVWDKQACEKMMGKESCEKMRAERGSCIMSKDECARICAANGVKCCAGGEPKSGCCRGKI